MTSHLNSHGTTDIKPKMLSGVENGTPHDKYDIRGIAHAYTNRKDDIFMQRRLYIDKAHMALDIFHFFYMYAVSLGDALTTAAVRQILYILLIYNVDMWKTSMIKVIVDAP